jgi:hypothetical protein
VEVNIWKLCKITIQGQILLLYLFICYIVLLSFFLERNISFKESIHNYNCGFSWFNLSLLIVCCLWQLPLCIGYTRLTSHTLEKNENALIHNGSCHKQQTINNDKLNHEKPQLQLWIDSLNEMFLSRWTAHEQWNITFILLNVIGDNFRFVRSKLKSR